MDEGKDYIEGPREVSATFTAKLTPEMRALFEQTQARFPSCCPHCGHRHRSEMFRQQGGEWFCMKCGGLIHLLPETKDEWPDTL